MVQSPPGVAAERRAAGHRPWLPLLGRGRAGAREQGEEDKEEEPHGPGISCVPPAVPSVHRSGLSLAERRWARGAASLNRTATPYYRRPSCFAFPWPPCCALSLFPQS